MRNNWTYFCKPSRPGQDINYWKMLSQSSTKWTQRSPETIWLDIRVSRRRTTRRDSRNQCVTCGYWIRFIWHTRFRWRESSSGHSRFIFRQMFFRQMFPVKFHRGLQIWNSTRNCCPKRCRSMRSFGCTWARSEFGIEQASIPQAVQPCDMQMAMQPDEVQRACRPWNKESLFWTLPLEVLNLSLPLCSNWLPSSRDCWK